MSNWPISVPGGGLGVSAVATTTTGAAPAFGAWVELHAAVPQGVNAIILHRMNGTASGVCMFELGVGSVGQEVVIADRMMFMVTNSSTHVADTCVLPLSLPAGARLAIRTSRATSGTVQTWRVEWIRRSHLTPRGGSRVVTYGYDAATLLGTSLTAGASGTWGTGVEVVSATPRRARFVSVTGFGAHNSAALRGLVAPFYGTSDRQAGPAFGVSTGSTNDTLQTMSTAQFFPCDIPAGSNLRLRLLHESTGNAVRAFQLHLVF